MIIPLQSVNHYSRWLKNTFKQAEPLATDCSAARSFIRSLAVYDHFATVALVDVLMVAPAVESTYAALYCERRHLQRSCYQRILDEQRLEHQQGLAFYLLIPPAHQGPTLSATNPRAAWIPSLVIGKTTYQPCIVRQIELEPEYKHIFGKKYSHFRDVYYLFFTVKELKRCCFNRTPFSLIISSVHHTMRLTW